MGGFRRLYTLHLVWDLLGGTPWEAACQRGSQREANEAVGQTVRVPHPICAHGPSPPWQQPVA